MPKNRRMNSLSSDRAWGSPYARNLENSSNGKEESSLPPTGHEKEWEEVRCAICMEHPHNAVLLLCSSSEKGCRPFMCDTSYRHSNCLDQFRKSCSEKSTTILHKQQPKLACPLCRGQIGGLVVREAARKYMNRKPRSCSLETCNFIGNYTDLRKHARAEHPTLRPSEADLSRQSEWRMMERQTAYEDNLSILHSSENDIEDDIFLFRAQYSDMTSMLIDIITGVNPPSEEDYSYLWHLEYARNISSRTDILTSDIDPVELMSLETNQLSNQASTRRRGRTTGFLPWTARHRRRWRSSSSTL